MPQLDKKCILTFNQSVIFSYKQQSGSKVVDNLISTAGEGMNAWLASGGAMKKDMANVATVVNDEALELSAASYSGGVAAGCNYVESELSAASSSGFPHCAYIDSEVNAAAQSRSYGCGVGGWIDPGVTAAAGSRSSLTGCHYEPVVELTSAASTGTYSVACQWGHQ
jgi:hypothetical protein